MSLNPVRSLPTASVVWLGFYAAIVIAWLGLFAMVRGNAFATFSDVPPSFWESLCIGAGGLQYGPLAAMWMLMSAAMMLPTFVPTLRTYVDLSAAGAADARGAAALVLAYAAVWLGISFVGAGAQWGLASAGLLSPLGTSQSDGLSAALLIGAGLYQFSRVKAACLSKCRMPITFFMERWRPGVSRAARMGAELGLVCVGCCWALMALGFVGGTMNLLWMGAATLFMILEKLPDIGRRLTRPAGYALVGAGCMVLLQTLVST